MRRRVVITGIGAVTPCGLGAETLWDTVINGRSAASEITCFDASDLSVRIACEVQAPDLLGSLPFRAARRLDRSCRLALVASSLAVEEAGIRIEDRDKGRWGVFDGTSLGPLAAVLEEHRSFLLGHKCTGGPRMMVKGMTGSSAASVALSLGLHGPAETYCLGSVSSTTAIGRAMLAIKHNELDGVIAGGCEAPIQPELMRPFAKAGVLSRLNHEPKRACRPFAEDRDGFVMGEGAVYLVLEELDHALARDARVICELAGFAESCDAYHETAPEPSGAGQAGAVRLCCERAGIELNEISYVNLHGTGTRASDSAESNMMRLAFGELVAEVWCGSSKPVTGHLLGACGAVESAVCAMSVSRGMIPSTINSEPRDTCCSVRIPERTITIENMRAVLNCNSSFGGRSGILAFRKYLNQ